VRGRGKGGRGERGFGIRQRQGGQEAGPTRRRSEKGSPELSICLESIDPAEDTLSDRFMNSNQDLIYRLTIKSSTTSLEG
jgi:hypothetical protein